MSTVDEIIGRALEEDDVPPVIAGRTRPATLARRDAPEDKEKSKLRDKARRSSMVAHILGMSESDHESIIPDTAKSVDPFSVSQIPGVKDVQATSQAPSEPSSITARDEELLAPTAALVAPDVTPKVFDLIDPSQVPAPPAPAPTPAAPGAPHKGALDTILGRPATVESFVHSITPVDTIGIKNSVAAKLIPSVSGGSGMPTHQEGDGRTIFDVARQIMG